MMKKYCFLAMVLFAVLIASGCTQDKQETVRQKAIGTELSYSDLSMGMQTKIVVEEDILAIESASCPSGTANKNCYKVSIGDPISNAPMWYIFYDAETLEQVKVEQLFVT